MALTKVTYSMIDGAYVNVLDFGATGDGTTDDTAAIQAAIDSFGASGGTVFLPKPTTSYLVSTLQMPTTGIITLLGSGKEVVCLVGDGSGPVIKTGIYPSSSLSDYRNLQYRNLRIQNTNHPCIQQHVAVNFVVENCALTTTGANTLDVAYSFRARIVGNRISTSGAFTAISCVDNSNGLVIDANVVTGGSAGNCINVEQSQGVAITNNIMETCGGFGISISSEVVTGSGNCNGVVVTGNYLEAIRYPFKFGKEATVSGLICRGNYVGNINIGTAGDYCFYIARVRDASIENNSCSGKGTEYFIGFGYKVSSGITVLNDSSIQNNFINGFVGNYAIDSTMTGLEANMETVFGTSVISFEATAPDIALKTVQSATYTCNVSSGSFVIIPASTEGGKIKYVDVYKDGTVNGRLRIGSTVNLAEVVDVADMSTLSYTGGYTRLTLAGTRIRRGEPVYITLNTGAGTGTFYVVIGYSNQTT